jgi:hypothetical protein
MVKYCNMNKNIILGLLYGSVLSLLFSQPALAATNPGCYGSLAGDAPSLGKFLPCFLEQIWKFFQKIFVAVALIMGMLLVYKTFTNRENSKVLEELPSKWMYLIIFVFLAFGAGGTILNFVFKLFGFGTLNSWIAPLNEIFSKWDQMTVGF